MRILIINTEKSWRGGERQTYFLLKGLRNAGIETELLCLKDYPLYQNTISLDLPINSFKTNIEVFKFLVKRGRFYDIIHPQTGKAHTAAIVTKPFHRRPIVYTRRVTFAPEGFFTKIKYDLTDRVVAISTAIKEILSKYGIEDVEIIPSIVEEKPLNIDRAKIFKNKFVPKDKKVISTISALTPEKDPFTMVKAVWYLSKLRNDFIFLHFGDGYLRDKVDALIKEFKIEDYYKLMGMQEDIEDFFSIFDVFVMSSVEEGLGSSVLDAFLYKVPVVSTDAGGLKETVLNRGLLCPQRDAKCLAYSINRLLNDKELKEQFTKKAYTDVVEYYSLEKCIQRYLRLYKEMLK